MGIKKLNCQKIIDGKFKHCSKCGKLQLLEMFHRAKRQSSSYASLCKKCMREYSATPEAKVRLRKYNATYNATPERKEKQQKRQTTTEYKEWLRKYYATTEYKERRKQLRAKPKQKLNHAISFGIYQSLKVKGGNKNGRRWEALVGYTKEDLKRHLEKHFDDWMTWENYGTEWHIDHDIAKKHFNFTDPLHEDFKRCWALKNLKPLEAKENMMKGARLDKPFQPSLAM